MYKETIKKLAQIKIVLLDLHGVLINNDGSESLSNCCEELKLFCSKLDALGVSSGILSADIKNEIRETITEETNCSVITTSINKLESAEGYLNSNNLGLENLLFVGDDILDLPLLQKVGFSAAPHSSRREVKRTVDYTCRGNSAKEILEEIYLLIEQAKS